MGGEQEAIILSLLARPKTRWLLVTLTAGSCATTDLRKTLTWMNKRFKRFRELKAFPGEGYVRTVEVTQEEGVSGLVRPCFHVLMVVKPSYFGAGYLPRVKWAEMWQRSLGVDYVPLVDVQPLDPQNSLAGLLAKAAKYSAKSPDREGLLELARQTHRTKAITLGGVLREEYPRGLEQKDKKSG
ncbi:protein rep [Anabaena minutissima FACHB-250]|nr:protein rep [Anabaena minutissima FACHB-250]